MAKKQPRTSVQVILPGEPTNQPQTVNNDIGYALNLPYSFGNLGYPQNQGTPFSEQVSNTTSMFRNLRWYFVSNFRQLLNQTYVEIGLVQTVVNVPVDDALRGGIKIKSKQLDDEELEALQISVDRDDDLNTAGQAGKWNRLFGGAGILILTDQDPEEPLDLDAIGDDTPLEFRAVDMWELFWDKQNMEGFDPSNQDTAFEYYSYYGVRVHKSRVMRLKGMEAPSFVRPRLRGWGFSVVEGLVRSLNQYFKGTDVLYEVLDEFKVDVFKIKNLVNTLLTPSGQEQVRRRVQLANWQKNYQNALTMDSEDEWDHKQLSLAGFGESLAQIRMQVAADMRMPMTKLFGISASGFNSGEDDLEVYNAMVEAQVRNKLKYPILRMLEIKCQKMFGFIPDDLSIEFAPLRMMTSEQEENVKNAIFNRLLQALQVGAVDVEFFNKATNKAGLFPLQLENVTGNFNPPAITQPERAATDGDDKNEDIDNPGADRADSQKSKAMAPGGITKGGPNKGETPKAQNSLSLVGGLEQYARSSEIGRLRKWTLRQKIMRILQNSPQFDRAAYEADGGDGWVDPRRHELFKDPARVDKSLWQKAKDASRAALGEERWQFVLWFYRRHCGKF